MMRIFIMTKYEIISKVEARGGCYYSKQKITTTLFGFTIDTTVKEVMYDVTGDYLMEVSTGRKNFVTDNATTAKAQLRYLGLIG
jgi:hypothetical protein